MPSARMSRDEFFTKLGPFDEDALRKVLWTLYWRGSAAQRERIAAELDPVEHARRKHAAALPPDPDTVLAEVVEFTELARSGAYIAGDRRVSPRERTRWRITFRRLAEEAQAALRAEDPGPAEQALALIIDLATEMKDREFFRSEDPVQAARFVVSDAAALLWQSIVGRHGFAAFADRAPTQLIRWESAHGWTRGWGSLGQKETSLASVLAKMLGSPDGWTAFADRYLAALDRLASADAARGGARQRSRGYDEATYRRRRRASDLAEWHGLLLDRLNGSEAEDRLDRLVAHPALGGPELGLVAARLAHQRGEIEGARKLIQDCLKELPGHQGMRAFAAELGVEPESA